ncbi:MAG: DUF3866 family protein [Acidimicrobiales bacterium]|nr:DUF3866 family protein [Acidimicrobiales bacterium]
MPSYRTGRVVEILAERRGLQRVTVTMGDDDPERAYVLTQLTGDVAVGDRVVLNTTAVDLGLGTGGWHVVHWNLEREQWSEPGPGHIMKLRYTSLQADTGAAEEELGDSLPTRLDGAQVVVCSLHSQVGVVAAAVGDERPETRVAYVMTDGAALPLALSDLVADLVARGLVHHTITAGHAFGGDLEAVTVPSALTLAKHHLGAEVIIVGMGPGVVGTGSTLGTTAIEAAAILDQVRALGGAGLIAPRMSDGDERHRHRGLSHHTATVLDLVSGPVQLPWPAPPPVEDYEPHVVVPVAVPDVEAMLGRFQLSITTMGRGPADDPLFFSAAAAAGLVAARRCHPD